MAPLEEAAAKAGEGLRFALLFFAFFEANLTAAGPEENTHERVAGTANCGAGCADIVRGITGVAFRLSKGFREGTTPMYFELLGYRTEYGALAGKDWLSVPENQQFARNLVSRLFDAGIGESSIPATSAIDRS